MIKGRDLSRIRLDLPETLLVQLVIGPAEAIDRWMGDPAQYLPPDDRV